VYRVFPPSATLKRIDPVSFRLFLQEVYRQRRSAKWHPASDTIARRRRQEQNMNKVVPSASWRITMSEPNAATATANANRTGLVFLVVAAVLIGTFLYRAVVPAHEYAMRDEQLLTMGIDLLLIIGLVGIQRKAQLPGTSVLFWIALVAGVGLFGIRLLGDDQWWTGHLVYYLEPRRF
jgi:hypothetical protein